MSTVERIQEQALKYQEVGLECPDFVFLSSDVYTTLEQEARQWATRVSGFSVIKVYTSVGELTVKKSSSLPIDTIVVGNHPITILTKLGIV